MSKAGKKFTFTLFNVNPIQILDRYGLESKQTDNFTEKNMKKTTKLTDLNTEKGTPEVVSFLDESKKGHTCFVSMIDFASQMDVNLLRYHCFWCRNPFSTLPIGCPLKYVSSQAEKQYHSHISKDLYTIKENITSSKRNTLETTELEDVTIKSADYYETDGVFCSFNCAKAWINDNKSNNKYACSNSLLVKMYSDITGTQRKVANIDPAPNWRLLEQYGGHLNIVKFREGFNKVDYKCHGVARRVPTFASAEYLYEENIKF